MLPSLLQLLCISLDSYLITKVKRMPRHYLVFALVRSLIRAYAQWFTSVETWQMVYWWGELLGYLVTILLIAGVAHKLMPSHLNTSTFYTLMGLLTTIVVIWRLPTGPLSLNALLMAGGVARITMGFLLLMAMALGKWDGFSRWLAGGIIINLACQTAGGWFEARLGPTLETSLIHQLGFLCLQLCWLVGINRRSAPLPSLVAL